MTALYISFLGSTHVTLNEQRVEAFRTSKVQALLFYLTAEPTSPHPREQLMNLLWPGMPDRSARHNLRNVLYHLRQEIPKIGSKPDAESDESDMVSLILPNRQTIHLNPAADVTSDIELVDKLIESTQTHDHPYLLTCRQCRTQLEQAASLYAGDFLSDFYLDDSDEFEEWALSKREHYRRKVLDALETLTTICMYEKAYVEARAYVERQIELDNLHENAYRQLMEILALSSQRSEALSVYESYRRLLSEELGMEPSTRTTQIYEQIRSGELAFDKPSTQRVRGYEIQDEIGKGAFGAVHKAIQPSVGREVAVKVILQEYADNPEFIRRFEAEAQTIAHLEHPYIVPLYDYWRDPEGAYLVMRYLRGGDLLSSLEAGPWTAELALKMLDQITSALTAAHRQGVIHLDIKPANILLDENGNAFLTDFGIAKRLTADNPLTTDGGAIAGTLDYISPEQILGEQISPQSDIYSLGAVLYETLTGERPFPDSSLASLLQKQLNEPVPLISDSRPDIPFQVDDIIQRATAKRPFDRFTDALEMAEAFRQALQGADNQNGMGKTAVSIDFEIINPYKGLRAFQESDSADFFGREKLVEQLVDRLADSPFVAVVGPSGGGKSSVVKAGLIPALRQGAIKGSEKWFVAEMVPGNHPLEELALALLPVAVDPPPNLVEPMQKDKYGLLRTIRRVLPDEESPKLLLVIDQFEELFTLVQDESLRIHFLDSLLAAIMAPHSPLHVVITLRADLYDRPLQVQPLGQWMKENTEVVLPMGADELTWAIQEPARRMGVHLEDGLVAAIVSEVIDEPGGLPLVQYAMTELFDARQDGMMTRRAYDKIGGVMGALGQRAETIYTNLDEAGQEEARQLFLRLVTLGEGVEDTRRRVQRTELESVFGNAHADVVDLVNAFGDARLLTFDRDPVTRGSTVEVAHEALLRVWERLRAWLETSREDVRMQRRLAEAAGEWNRAEQHTGFLMRESRLDQFAGWVATSTVALTADEHAFLNASITAREEREAEEETRRQQELETARKLAETEHARAEEQVAATQNLRRRAAYLGVALVFAAVLAITAVFTSIQANNNANTAATQKAIAVVEAEQRATAQAQAEIESQRADVERDVAIDAQATAVAEGARADEQRDVALAAGAEADEARLVAEEQAQIGLSRELAAKAVNNLTEDPERSVLLALQALNTAHTQEAEEALHRGIPNLRLLQAMAGHEDGIASIAYSPDGSRLVSTSYDNVIRVWDTADGQELLLLSEPEEEVIRGQYLEVDYSSDGSYFATGGEHGTAKVWDAATGELLTTFTGHRDILNPFDPDRPNLIFSLSIRPDSKTIATGDISGLVKLWDAATGAELKTFDLSETGAVYKLQFSPDGARLIVYGENSELGNTYIKIIEIDSGSDLLTIEGRINDFALSPDGTRLVFSETYDKVVRLWDLDAMTEIARYSTGETDVLAFNSDGSLFSTRDKDLDRVHIWETETGSEVMTVASSQGHVTNILFSPDGTSLATAGWDKLVKLWDITPDHELMTIQPFSEDGWVVVSKITFSPDGSMLAAGGGAGGVSLWDPVTGERLLTLAGHDDWVGGLGFSPDGDRLASGGDDNLVKVWDTTTGELLLTLDDHEEWVNNMAYSPDGATIASIGDDAQSFIWDAITGEVLHQLPVRNVGWGIAYSPDSTLLATGSLWNPGENENVTIWDVATGQAVSVINNKEGADEVLFSADGSLLITGGVDGFVRIWDVETGQLLQEIEADKSVIFGSSLSPDGKILATAAGGSDVRLWDVQSGERLLTLEGSVNSINLVAFTQDGKQLATSGSEDGNVRFLVLSVDELVEIAESRLTRPLTEEECREYLHMDACPVE